MPSPSPSEIEREGEDDCRKAVADHAAEQARIRKLLEPRGPGYLWMQSSAAEVDTTEGGE